MAGKFKKEKKVLIITFYFPPFEGIASLRAGKFAKFLPEYGWEPIVLTVEKIPGLKKNLPVETDEERVFRTPWFDIFSIFKRGIAGDEEKSIEKSIRSSILRRFVRLLKSPFEAGFVRLPDRTLGWIPYALKKGKEIIKSEKPRIIFSSGGPVSSHMIASILHKKTSVPWIADYRDLWSGNYFFPRHFLIDKIEALIEKRVMKNVSAFTTVSEELLSYLKKLHGKDVFLITNGFDEEDYNFDVVREKGKMRIIYTGNIYPGKREVEFFFRVISNIIKEMDLSPDFFSLEFYSSITGKIPELVKKYNLEGFVKINPFLPYEECRKVQKSADLLLILESPEEAMKGVATGKIFEYLGAERPILAIAPEGGAIDRILKETKRGIAIHSEEELKEILTEFVHAFRKGEEPSFFHERKCVKKYTRRALTEILSRIMDDIYGKKFTTS